MPTRVFSEKSEKNRIRTFFFFSAKTHKLDIPVRTIITERSTWQHEVSTFLQFYLSALNFRDPFLVEGSNQVVDFLATKKLSNSSGFSIDVVDLFYSVTLSS